MEIKQSDRDALRASQQKINEKVIIGNIVEHKTQDPKKYKELSSDEQTQVKLSYLADYQLSSSTNKIELNYESKFLNSESKKPDVIEKLSINGDLPIKPQDVQANSWLNMDQLEYDKLEWLTKNYQKSNHDRVQQPSTTKFDKEGRAIPNHELKKPKKSSIPEINNDLDSIKADEDIEEIYDINELINLLSSTYQRHTTYSLMVVRKIANLANCGFYDGSFDENIHTILLRTCLLRVRSHMDSADKTTCLNALTCLKSLLCNTEIDEINLDRIHPVICDDIDINIWTASQEQLTKEFTEEMKDQECVEIDPIMALIERTNLVQRIIYLLSINVAHDFHNCILDILIRIVRHSKRACSIINDSKILFNVAELFLPTTITSDNENIRALSYKALKLIRIVVQAFVNSEDTCNEKTQVIHLPDTFVEAIQAYFFIDYHDSSHDNKKSLVMLHIESLRIVKILSKLKSYNVAMLNLITLGQSILHNSARSLVSLKSTNDILSPISLDWQYAAHIIDLFGHYKTNHYKTAVFINTFLNKYINPSLLNWLNDIMKEKHIPHLDVSITITVAYKHLNNYQGELDLNNLIIHNTSLGTNNEFFKLLIREAHNRSSLCRFLEVSGNLRDPDMLRSYGTLNFNTTNEQKFILCPMLDKNSPYLLLNMIISKLHESTVAYNLHFINDISFFRYIKTSTSYYNSDATYESQIRQSSIAQYEVKLIANLLLLVVRYYLDFTNEILSRDDFETKTKEQLDEPAGFEQAREDCYSNIFHYTIGLIGLLNTENFDGAELRGKLLENILFNQKLQYRLRKENFKTKLNFKDPLKSWRDLGFKDESGVKLYELDNEQYDVLFSLYKTVSNYDRYWIFQPVLLYYSNQICLNEKEPKTRDNRWFNNNLIWKTQTAPITYCNDAKLISATLRFHFSMLIYCPTYTFITIKPNVEDYLCLIGCLFLHDDIFLDEDLNKSIEYNIRMILNDCFTMSEGKVKIPFKDASRKILPLNNLPLADFFSRLIDQYESVSYGNNTFSNFLLLFISTGSDLIFRKKLFQERTETCLSVLKINVEDLWTPKELFFNSRESDPEMKLLLKKSIPYISNGSFLQEYVYFHIR